LINQKINHKVEEKICQIILKNPNNIANGIIHQTSILVRGANIATCQKVNNMIGNVVVKADIVKIKLSFIAKKRGKK
jgi:hypothetical protein